MCVRACVRACGHVLVVGVGGGGGYIVTRRDGSFQKMPSKHVLCTLFYFLFGNNCPVFSQFDHQIYVTS